MTLIGVDDTDSRERGMCTTYVAARIAERIESVERLLLVRLNPAVPYKTRGNAALAIHTDCDPDRAFEIAHEELAALAETADAATNPGLVVGSDSPPEAVRAFARDAVCDHLTIEDAVDRCEQAGYRHAGWGNGRGRIGALAAIGAWDAFDAWTYELISYRDPDRWGTPRQVESDSVFSAADAGYPTVWDTVDCGEHETVCVPHTPGPILHGIRGDDPDAVRQVATQIESEPIDSQALFVTNQGTDSHVQTGALGSLEDGGAYRVTGVVLTEPETRRGGHVFVTIGSPRRDGDTDLPHSETQLECAAFEPTKRFRDHVRALRPGDRVTVCGECSDGTLKLEKFAVRDLVRTELTTPTCPDCGKTMKSAGRNQGYRCRACETSSEKVPRALTRDLEIGWYEVPPCARRHIAKPLIRGGFDAPTHPER